MRVLRGLTVLETARRAGVSRKSLQRWESGEHAPRGDALASLLATLEASPQERAALTAESPHALSPSALVGTPLGPPAHPGHLLRALRERRGLSQGRLAEVAGVSQQAVALWEAGRTMAGGEPLGRALTALGAEEVGLRDDALDLYDPLVDPLDARLRLRDCRFLPANSLSLPRLIAIERELWPLAARDARWEEALAEVLASRASFHASWGEHTLALELARRALRLAESSGSWDAVHAAFNTLACLRVERGLSPVRLIPFWSDYARRVRNPAVRATALARLSARRLQLGDRPGYERDFARAEALVREAEPDELFDPTHPMSPFNAQDYDCHAVTTEIRWGDLDRASRAYEDRLAGGWGQDWERRLVESGHDHGHFHWAYVRLHVSTGQPVPEAALRILDAHARAATRWDDKLDYVGLCRPLGIYTPEVPKPR